MIPERLMHILADKDCPECNGEGIVIDYEGYPMPMPAHSYPCSCTDEKMREWEYFERPYMPYEHPWTQYLRSRRIKNGKAEIDDFGFDVNWIPF
jgi:hypothetical protein